MMCVSAARTSARRCSNQPASVTEENAMATYVTLYNFTEQGLRNIKDTVKPSGSEPESRIGNRD